MSTNQKVAIITGASSGIGRASAVAFGRDGHRVLAVGRQEAALAAVAAEISRGGSRAEVLAVDVTAVDAPDRIVARAVDRFGGIDVLVNAAGIIGSGTIETTTDAAWDAMLDINVRAPFRLVRAALPHLIAGQGAIVNVSSVTGLRSFPGVLAYCVSKAAVDHFTRCVALELAARGVRVNAVNPGVVVSNLHRRGGMNEEQYAAFLERARETHPLGRPGRPEEVAELILFLGTDRSRWMTGETIPIDGGRNLTCAR
jgi:NAD(P)-dependent dehydrogenase (short-subunit alcohol dehydrogenase family)